MKTVRRYNNLFDALYGMLDNEVWMSHTTGGAIPAINITDSEQQYELEFAVPGMTKEDFGIQIDTNDNLVVSTEKTVQPTEGKRYLRVENGILYIVLPKLKPEVVKPEVRTIGIA